MTPLLARLAERIRRDGPLGVDAYMALALDDYYAARDPLGTDGDFTTAPEISQLFGEMLGLWCADLWQRAGRPAPWRLVELGPGRGTLMADALRALATVPACRDAARVHLVETSPALQARQAAALADAAPAWHVTLADVPPGPTLLLANEFFDALPVQQRIATADGWRERRIGLDGDRLVFVAGPPADGPDAPPGTIMEVAPARDDWMRAVATRLTRHGGAALVVDYGPAESAVGETLQAVRGHAYADALATPGEADLTAHVDFAALAETARAAGAQVHGPATQRDFLVALGILPRAEALAGGAQPAARRGLETGLERLIGQRHMGTLFKAMAVTGRNAPRPAGFA